MDEKPNNTNIYEQEYENEYENLPAIKERVEHKHECPMLFVGPPGPLRAQQRLVGLTDISQTEYHHLRCSWRAQSDGSCITTK